MRLRTILFAALFGAAADCAQDAPPTPGFHHLHINSQNPDAGIQFHATAFKSMEKTTFAVRIRAPRSSARALEKLLGSTFLPVGFGIPLCHQCLFLFAAICFAVSGKRPGTAVARNVPDQASRLLRRNHSFIQLLRQFGESASKFRFMRHFRDCRSAAKRTQRLVHP